MLFFSNPIRLGLFTYSTLFGVDIILLNISRHPKICHLTFLSFPNKNISGRQVTMDYLKQITFYVDCFTAIVIFYFENNLSVIKLNYYRLLPSWTTNKPSHQLSATQTSSTALKLDWFSAFYPGY